MSNIDLFDKPLTRMFPRPRDFQQTTHEALRSGFIEGHQRQVVCAPTGAGNTYLGLRIIDEALKRGKRAVFVCDRKTLIRQTDIKAQEYGMPIASLFQGGNPRMDLARSFQIASAQTFE